VLLQSILFNHWQAVKAGEEYRLTKAQITLNQGLKSNDLAAFDNLASITNQHENISTTWLNILTFLLLILWFTERLVSEITIKINRKTIDHNVNHIDEATR
jgi:hypothetical protein